MRTHFPECPQIEETGTTFLENARLKAEGISRVVDGWVLSDDSGLEVDALDGAPGVWSSSFGGDEGNHARNNARLIAEMTGKTDRRARFRCTMVLAREGLEQANFSRHRRRPDHRCAAGCRRFWIRPAVHPGRPRADLLGARRGGEKHAQPPLAGPGAGDRVSGTQQIKIIYIS